GTRAAPERSGREDPRTATRIAADSLRPTWASVIPSVAIQCRVGQGDISPQAVTQRGDSVAIFGPVPPRDRKQLSYTYVLPATVRRVSVPVDQPIDEVDLLLEDTTAVVTTRTLDSLGIEDIEGRRFARYRSTALPAGAPLAIAFSDRRFAPETLLPVIVGLAGLALRTRSVVCVRRKPP